MSYVQPSGSTAILRGFWITQIWWIVDVWFRALAPPVCADAGWQVRWLRPRRESDGRRDHLHDPGPDLRAQEPNRQRIRHPTTGCHSAQIDTADRRIEAPQRHLERSPRVGRNLKFVVLSRGLGGTSGTAVDLVDTGLPPYWWLLDSLLFCVSRWDLSDRCNRCHVLNPTSSGDERSPS